MESVSELVEESLHIVKRKEGRLVGCRLREVAHIHDYRTDVLATDDFLIDEVRHPGTASLCAAWEVVGKDHSDERTVCISHLEAFNILVIYRDILKLLVLKSPEFCGKVEYSLTDVLHLEIWLCLFLVEGIFCLAHLLCIISPVPRLDHAALRKEACLDILVHKYLHISNLFLCLSHSRSHYACKE